MAQGYRTFLEAKSAAQETADRSGQPVSVWRNNPTAKVYKFAINPRAKKARMLTVVQPATQAHRCMDNAVPYSSDGALGHGWECGLCGAFLQAG